MGYLALFLLSSALAFGGSWEGVLVNSTCYDDVERNVNPWESAVDGARDRNYEIRYCRANARTKAFTIVQPDGQSFRLDAAGSTKAAEIVRSGNSKYIFVVSATGELNGRIINAASLLMLRNVPPR